MKRPWVRVEVRRAGPRERKTLEIDHFAGFERKRGPRVGEVGENFQPGCCQPSAQSGSSTRSGNSASEATRASA